MLVKPDLSRIGLLGYGTVGRSVADILDGSNCRIIRVGVRDIAKYEANPGHIHPSRFTDDPYSVIEDPSVKAVLEATGGTVPALKLAKRCLQLGKPFITANKELIATHFDELGNHPLVRYEAAVAAAIPIVEDLKRLSVYDEILSIEGIMNGTTNYMLTEMAGGVSYESVLKQAQDLGYAEADPTSDVGGFDAGFKISILGSIASKKFITAGEVNTTGIIGITEEELARAKAEKKVIKLIASFDGKTCSVGPQMLDLDHPLARVNGSMNAISVTLKNAGTLFWQGPGAGGSATASAMLKDLAQFQA